MRSLKYLLALLVALAVLHGCSTDTPEDVARAFTEAAYSGDVERTIELVDLPAGAPSGRGERVHGKLQVMTGNAANRAAALGGIDRISVAPAEYSDDHTRATVPVTLSFKASGARDHTDWVHLVKAGGSWKIRL
ncbi:DUF4878 domain-containing protein [Stutzerimonas nosocomialis]|uniref:DUF4878 domain-containing protein n=1 Tax=Stutzerimonas nosocomialis TaxID=1056496 RepID=UPI0013051EDA|nr:DUF4878 domain-containing protein [Stutzerimonas nosocomialis]